jgi:serine phosphatase RsbU (regulator of sigma subunit)
VEALISDGPALGVAPGFEHSSRAEANLEPGDMLLLFSDGISEAAHEDAPKALFGEERIGEVLLEAGRAGEDSKALCDRLSEAGLQFSGGRRDDDWTLMALRRTP